MKGHFPPVTWSRQAQADWSCWQNWKQFFPLHFLIQQPTMSIQHCLWHKEKLQPKHSYCLGAFFNFSSSNSTLFPFIFISCLALQWFTNVSLSYLQQRYSRKNISLTWVNNAKVHFQVLSLDWKSGICFDIHSTFCPCKYSYKGFISKKARANYTFASSCGDIWL